MRCLSALALLTLAATPALAQDVAPAPTPVAQPPRLTLVEVFETNQALVFDRVERQYLVVRAGSAIQGFRVAAVHSQQIELTSPNQTNRSYIVTLPVPRRAPPVTAPATPAPATAPAPAPAPAPAQMPAEVPAPAPAVNSDGPIDPYAGATRLPEREITVVQAPRESQPAEPKREPTVVSAPKASQPKTATPAPRPAPEAAPDRPAVLTRKELDGALANLEALSSEIDLKLTGAGVVVERVSAGTLGHRLGLRAGDVIRKVAGIPTLKLEDGADVYVKLGQIDRFDIEITRSGRRMALPVVIK